jgi:poly(A) polymerase Pap1
MKLKKENGDEKIVDLHEPIADFYRQDLVPEHAKLATKGDLSVRIAHLERCELPDTVFDGSRPCWAIKKQQSSAAGHHPGISKATPTFSGDC